jgi:hypothetical protein
VNSFLVYSKKCLGAITPSLLVGILPILRNETLLSRNPLSEPIKNYPGDKFTTVKEIPVLQLATQVAVI